MGHAGLCNSVGVGRNIGGVDPACAARRWATECNAFSVKNRQVARRCRADLGFLDISPKRKREGASGGAHHVMLGPCAEAALPLACASGWYARRLCGRRYATTAAP